MCHIGLAVFHAMSVLIDILLSHVSPPPSPTGHLSGGVCWTLTQLHGWCVGVVTSPTHIHLASVFIDHIEVKLTKLSPAERGVVDVGNLLVWRRLTLPLVVVLFSQ